LVGVWVGVLTYAFFLVHTLFIYSFFFFTSVPWDGDISVMFRKCLFIYFLSDVHTL
jgi:hypothetical protein